MPCKENDKDNNASSTPEGKDEEVIILNDDNSDEDNDNEPTQQQIIPKNQQVINYSSLLSIMTELARTIQNDKEEMAKVYNTVTEAIDVYRRGGKCFFNLQTDGLEAKNTLLTALSSKANNASTMKRKCSAREQRVRKFQKKGFAVSQLSQEEDDDDGFLPAANPKTKTCILCRQPKHTILFCNKLSGYGRQPLARNDQQVRFELVQCLQKEAIYNSKVLKQNFNEEVIKKLPQGIRAMILHEKCEFEGDSSKSFVLRCSLLFEEGDSNLMFKDKLFDAKIIFHWITKSKSNIVVNGIPFKVRE